MQWSGRLCTAAGQKHIGQLKQLGPWAIWATLKIEQAHCEVPV